MCRLLIRTTPTLLPWEQLSRTPRFISRTLATQAPFPTASTSTSTSTPEPLSEGIVGGGEGLGAQTVFPGGDVDVTDSVLKMLESEDGGFLLLLSTHQQGSRLMFFHLCRSICLQGFQEIQTRCCPNLSATYPSPRSPPPTRPSPARR